MKRKLQRLSLAMIGTFLLFVLLGITYLQLQTYPAETQVEKLAQKSSIIKQHYRIFKGRDGEKSIIIYPGALVESTSYAGLAHQLQKIGYNVYLIESPLNLPILDDKAALNIIQENALSSQNVVLIGHSLGGVVAAYNAQELLEQHKGLAGLIFLASYPSSHTDLSQANFPILSITAEHDQVINQASYIASKERLPKSTLYSTIQGGNHSGFGMYGQQKGDGHATISSIKQQDEIVGLIKQVLQ